MRLRIGRKRWLRDFLLGETESRNSAQWILLRADAGAREDGIGNSAVGGVGED